MKGSTGFIYYDGKLHPVADHVHIRSHVPVGSFALSSIVTSVCADREVTALPPYPAVTTLYDNSAEPRLGQYQYTLLRELTCRNLWHIPRGLKRLHIHNTTHQFTHDEMLQLAERNPDLVDLDIGQNDGNRILTSIFPRLQKLRINVSITGQLPQWIVRHPTIRVLRFGTTDLHPAYDLTGMTLLEECYIASSAAAIITLDIADSVRVSKYGGMRIVSRNNPSVDRDSAVYLGPGCTSVMITKHTRSIEAGYSYAEPLVEFGGNVNELRVSHGNGSMINWITKLTSLQNLVISTTSIVPLNNLAHIMTTLTTLDTRNDSILLSPGCCRLLAPRLTKLSAWFVPDICLLTGLTILSLDIANILPPEIYRLAALRILHIRKQSSVGVSFTTTTTFNSSPADSLDASYCNICINAFPLEFSTAFPLLEEFYTSCVIITEDMCGRRPALRRWEHRLCADHIPPAALSRHIPHLMFTENYRNIPYKCPRALLGPTLYMMGGDFTPFYTSAEAAVAACTRGHVAMREYMEYIRNRKVRTWFSVIPRDIIGLIAPYVDDDWVVDLPEL